MYKFLYSDCKKTTHHHCRVKSNKAMPAIERLLVKVNRTCCWPCIQCSNSPNHKYADIHYKSVCMSEVIVCDRQCIMNYTCMNDRLNQLKYLKMMTSACNHNAEQRFVPVHEDIIKDQYVVS